MIKNKPDWQKGCLNGIGGKIEEGEKPIDAVFRELEEEAVVSDAYLKYLGIMRCTNNDNTDFSVYVYTGITKNDLAPQEDEPIVLIKPKDIKKHNHIKNVPMLVEASKYLLTGKSHFKNLIMEY